MWEQSSGSYTMTNTYDDMGRVKRVTEPGLEKNYTHDVAGNRESFETKVLGNVKQDLRYTYDKRGNMTEVSAPGTGISATYSYDENGNMTRELSDVYSDTDYTYNRDNTVSEISTFRIISSEKLEYTHYRNGNIKTEVSSKYENGSQVGNTKTTTYEYDTQNRLSKETVGGSVMTYTYDSFGNRATKTVEDGGALQQEVSYTYDDANRLKKTVEEQHNTYETYTTYYQYDANGNLTLRAREIIAPSEAAGTTALLQNSTYIDTFQFNDYGEMTSAFANGKKSTYSYRPDGLRINKTVDGVRTRHVLDGQNVSMDLNDDWSTKFSFIRGVRLVGYIDSANGSKYFYNFNAHGDVLGAVGGLNSTAQTRYTYDAFGNSSKTGSSANPFQYCGEYTDNETGLLYLRARYYEPAIGRFISEDPIRAEINWYSYCENDPVNQIDPNGLDSYVFYDENDNGFVTYEKALQLKKDMEALYGTPCHLVAIGRGHKSEKTGKTLSAADYFKEKWNLMGRAGNGKIEGVVLYFHGPSQGQGISFKKPGGTEWENNFLIGSVDELNVKTMDTLILLGCNTGKVTEGKSNIATELACRMNANYTIASDGKTYTRNKNGNFQVKTEGSPKGFKVYKKIKDGSGKVSASRLYLFNMYRDILDIIKKAKEK